MRFLLLNIFFASVIFSCKVDPKINVRPKVQEIVPQGWPKPVYTFSTNVLSENKFQLGRALFYDPILSIDSTVSCASCHQNFAAFANMGHPVSHGITDTSGNELDGTRNTPALFNLNWHPYFMHDGGINHIEVQPLGPITNSVEMGESVNHVIQKLQRSARYRRLFYNDEVNSVNMLKALAQFMGMLYSYNSKYDRIVRREKKMAFSESEAKGYQLFLNNCNSCHTEPLFSDFKFRSNGLSVSPVLNDSGRAKITGLAADNFKFKTPSLRNIDVSPPYMHDGRYTTLEDCLDHYTKAFANPVNIASELPAGGFNLSSEDKSNLISFLKTLTDTSFINDVRFKDPQYN